MKFSIIVPICNVEKYLDRCLESIKNQSFNDFEVLMVNDGSLDDSIKIAQSYLKDERFVLMNQENCGVSSARNKGLENAKGEYILFVDSDDFLNENCLSILNEKSKDKDVVFFNYLDLSNNHFNNQYAIYEASKQAK